MESNQKVTADHLRRGAYLYVRQSTLRQVQENTESTKRQYALRQKAISLGWPGERITVIDSDLGLSGAQSEGREGFQHLVAEAGLGNAGLIMGLEVSRLARNSSDWHRLLEICGLTNTLILDEDGIYNPGDFNDRLLLGLKGTMSEAELHFLKARMRGGQLTKAKRGELKMPLPVGLVYNSKDEPILDPDKQVQSTITLFFETFRRTGSACATVKEFQRQGILFPRKIRKGINKGDLVWGDLMHSRSLQVLHNPRYAGAFFYGQKKGKKNVDGSYSTRKLPQSEWFSLHQGAHEGYISWEEFQQNQARLLENSKLMSPHRGSSPPREGCALLQGRVLCGICGQRMTVQYYREGLRTKFVYICQRKAIEQATAPCQRLVGTHIDDQVGKLLVELIAPAALEASLAVAKEIENRAAEVDQIRLQQVERSHYEAELAKRRYMHVDPGNRLVADSLEAEWNQKLRELERVQAETEQLRQADRASLSEEQSNAILALTADFPRLWNDATTSHKERKRMLALLIEDVALTKGDDIQIGIRFKGGASQVLSTPKPPAQGDIRRTPPHVVDEIGRLLNEHTDAHIAQILNERGELTGNRQAFSSKRVEHIRRTYGLGTRYDRARQQGLLTPEEMATLLNISEKTLPEWRKKGLVKGYRTDARNTWLYAHPSTHDLTDATTQKYSCRQEILRSMVRPTGGHVV
jgi:DNA invertase Pin-like site-specific DNA recombinase